MKLKFPILILGCSLLLAGFIDLGSDSATAAQRSRALTHPTGQTSAKQTPTKQTPTKQNLTSKPASKPSSGTTGNNIKLLGYGLFLIHIGLKPFESARQGDLKLSKRLAEPAPMPESQGQHQSID
jgi:hypothetical protein